MWIFDEMVSAIQLMKICCDEVVILSFCLYSFSAGCSVPLYPRKSAVQLKLDLQLNISHFISVAHDIVFSMDMIWCLSLRLLPSTTPASTLIGWALLDCKKLLKTDAKYATYIREVQANLT